MARKRISIQEFVYRAKTFVYSFEPYGFDKHDFTRAEWREIERHSGEECRILDLAMEDHFIETESYEENFDNSYWNVEFEDGYQMDAVQGVSLKEAGRDPVVQDDEDIYIRKSIDDDEELANLRTQAELHNYSPEFESLMENLSLDSLEKYLEKHPDFRLINDFEYTYADDPIFEDAEGDELSLDDVENAGWLKGYEVWLPAGLNFKFEGPISNKGGLGYINFRLPSINKVITFNTDYSNLKEFFSFTDTGLDKHFDETEVDDLANFDEAWTNQKLNVDEVIGWISEHDELYSDFKNYFGYKYDENSGEETNKPEMVEIEDWLIEHEQAWEDFKNFFKSKLKEAVDIHIDDKDVTIADNSGEDVAIIPIDPEDDEQLTEEKSDDIKDFITQLYDLRKKSIEEEGEYGLGNLVFKEFRNKGYLDNLKDQRKVEKGKELSLETLDEGMEDKVKRTTKDFTKEHGQIMCNDGEQKEEVVKLLKEHGYEVEVNQVKKGSVAIKYHKGKLDEVWTNGSGPGFYEPIDYIYRDLDKCDFDYEMFQDEEKTYFIVDEANSQEMQEIVLNQCGDYEIEGPDPTGKVSIVVDNSRLYYR